MRQDAIDAQGRARGRGGRVAERSLPRADLTAPVRIRRLVRYCPHEQFVADAYMVEVNAQSPVRLRHHFGCPSDKPCDLFQLLAWALDPLRRAPLSAPDPGRWDIRVAPALATSPNRC